MGRRNWRKRVLECSCSLLLSTALVYCGLVWSGRQAEAGEAEERGLALEAVPGAGYGAAAAGLEEAPEDEAEEAEEARSREAELSCLRRLSQL